MRYSPDALRKVCYDVMRKVGLPEEEARINGESLVFADLRGLSSHGVTRLRTYAERVEKGVVHGGQSIRIVEDGTTILHVDAQNGTGSYMGCQVMELCMERASQYGSCMAAVSNANHFGTGAFFALQAVKKGMIAFNLSNAPASVVPTGGRKPMLGTNPLCVAIPAGKYQPLVLDMATSVVAQGKIILAKKEGKTEIPAGWAVDRDGNVTTDPTAALAGAMLPFGGPKGYAIGLIIDILCSILSGANDSRHINNFWKDYENPQNLGHFMGVIDISKIIPSDVFTSRMDQMIEEFKACPSAPGASEVLIPGEIEFRLYENNSKLGVELGENVVKDLKALCEEKQVEWPF